MVRILSPFFPSTLCWAFRFPQRSRWASGLCITSGQWTVLSTTPSLVSSAPPPLQPCDVDWPMWLYLKTHGLKICSPCCFEDICVADKVSSVNVEDSEETMLCLVKKLPRLGTIKQGSGHESLWPLIFAVFSKLLLFQIHCQIYQRHS